MGEETSLAVCPVAAMRRLQCMAFPTDGGTYSHEQCADGRRRKAWLVGETGGGEEAAGNAGSIHVLAICSAVNSKGVTLCYMRGLCR